MRRDGGVVAVVEGAVAVAVPEGAAVPEEVVAEVAHRSAASAVAVVGRRPRAVAEAVAAGVGQTCRGRIRRDRMSIGLR